MFMKNRYVQTAIRTSVQTSSFGCNFCHKVVDCNVLKTFLPNDFCWTEPILQNIW